MRRMSLLTRTDQKRLSFALASLWKLIPGFSGLSCRSKAVVLTAFCSSPVSRARLSVKVSAMRNSMAVPLTPSRLPDGKHTDTRGQLVDADDGALVQRGRVGSKHPHDVRTAASGRT